MSLATTREATPARRWLPIAVVLLAIAIPTAGWLLGSALAPTQDDAAVAHQAAYEEAYDASRAAEYETAYEDAWELNAPAGAAAGQREGALAGAAAARRPAS